MAKYQGDIFNNVKFGDEDEDEFYGSWGDDSLYGMDGDDYLDGQEGNDFVQGGAGNDEVRGGSGDDHLSGGSGDDELKGGEGNDVLFGGSGDDDLYGGDGDDRIEGESGDDYLNGGDGNDTLNGGGGDDDLYGGNGDDNLNGDSGADYIYAVNGVDKVDGGSGNDEIVVEGNDGFRFDRVTGGSGNDTIVVEGTRVYVTGGADDDTIQLDLAADQLLFGGTGGDRFVIADRGAYGGKLAELYGGEGLVTFGGLGWESASISNVTDTSPDTLDISQLQGLSTSTALPDVGFVDRMIVDLGQGTLTNLVGEVGFGTTAFQPSPGPNGLHSVQLAKLFGIENVIGSSGADTITGNTAANDLRGGGGDDVIKGGAGADTILGGSGADLIEGGTGADTLTGGADADTFVFTEAAKTTGSVPIVNPITGQQGTITVQVSVTDKITDFQTGQVKSGGLFEFGTQPGVSDKLDFSSLIDARTNFAGTTALQAFQQGYIYLVQHGTEGQPGFGTTVMLDLNGGAHTDAANNFAIVDLEGVRSSSVGSQHFMI